MSKGFNKNSRKENLADIFEKIPHLKNRKEVIKRVRKQVNCQNRLKGPENVSWQAKQQNKKQQPFKAKNNLLDTAKEHYATYKDLKTSLDQKNKEIEEMKKSQIDDISSFQNLAQVVAKVQALRINQKSNGKIIREKVSGTTRLIRDVHKSLTFLGKKSSDADQAIAMFTHCQEKFQNLNDAKPFEVPLDGAKRAVANYVGSFCKEYTKLQKHLDEDCEILLQALVKVKGKCM